MNFERTEQVEVRRLQLRGVSSVQKVRWCNHPAVLELPTVFTFLYTVPLCAPVIACCETAFCLALVQRCGLEMLMVGLAMTGGHSGGAVYPDPHDHEICFAEQAVGSSVAALNLAAFT